MSWDGPTWLHWPRTRRTRLAAWAGLALLAIVLLWWLIAWLLRPREQGPPPAAVTISEARQGAVQIILRGLGQVQAFNTYTARSRVDGNITMIAFKEGSHVHAGNLLVQVDSRPYQAALKQAQATTERDAAQLANARLDLQRYVQLLPEGLTTRQTYDTQAATIRQLAATVKSDQAQIDQAKLNLGYTQIRAPFGGRTGQRLVDLGNLLSAASQTPLVVLTQTEPIFVSFTLPELDLGQVVTAMHRGLVKVEAFDSDDQKQIASGTLTVLDNTVDASTGTVRLKAQYRNSGEVLWPGEFVNAHIVIAVQQHAITIPSGAVQMGPNGRFVFRVGPQNKAQVVPVTVGQIENGQALVSRGLKAGDKVIVDGAFGLSAGDPVQISGRAGTPTTQGPLDMTGRTAQMPGSDNSTGNGASGNHSTTGAAPGSDEKSQKQEQPPQPTQKQPPQKQTPSGGRALNGQEGPGARTPLPNQRQVPEPAPNPSQNHSQQENGNGQ